MVDVSGHWYDIDTYGYIQSVLFTQIISGLNMSTSMLYLVSVL